MFLIERGYETWQQEQGQRAASETTVRAAIDTFLANQFGQVPHYGLEAPDDGVSWAFWILEDDTTSYVHPDLRIEWYGTAWNTETPRNTETPTTYRVRLAAQLGLASDASNIEILARAGHLRQDVQRLEDRQQELLQFIRRLSTEVADEDAAAELERQRQQIAVLMAEIGTLRSATRSLPAPTATATYTPARTAGLPRCVYCNSVAVYTKDGSLDVKTVEDIGACAYCGEYQEDGLPIPFEELR